MQATNEVLLNQNSIKRHLQQFRRKKRLQTGSLIITLFGDAILLRGGRIWLGSLINLLKPLDINERLIRTSVFRLVKESWLRSETVGRRANYVITASGLQRFEKASRHIYASNPLSWDNRWRWIIVVGKCKGKLRDSLKHSLFWQGFGNVGSDCFVHPSADLKSIIDGLYADGLGGEIGNLLPLYANSSHLIGVASNNELVKRAWNLKYLSKAYNSFVKVYSPIAEELKSKKVTISNEEAFLLRLLLIHDYRRLLLRDPELPDSLLPVNWIGNKAKILCKSIYRAINSASDEHLQQNLLLADGRNPQFEPSTKARFP